MADYSNAQNTTPARTADNTISTHLLALDHNNRALYELTQKLAHIGDRLLGVRPESVGKSAQTEPPPGSLVLSLHRREREMLILIGSCTDLACRIESALGENRD